MDERYIITSIGHVHRQANKFIESELRKNEIGGIAPSHGDILFQLYKNESLTMQQLAKLIDRDKSTVTVLVNKLVDLGYISKTLDVHDARVSNLSVTQKGKELRPLFEEISNRLLAKVYSEFTHEEKTILLQLLQKIKL
ncbi:MAG: transcriptional regulator [Firmicutes bacterium]|nr:transcriptional regulator [Bacillota bacterium]